MSTDTSMEVCCYKKERLNIQASQLPAEIHSLRGNFAVEENGFESDQIEGDRPADCEPVPRSGLLRG
jgi:hypothetical protein